MSAAREREALRQQLLLRALWRDGSAAQALPGWTRALHRGGADDANSTHGLAAYRANAGAVAERALAGAYPTVAALLGEESFAALAHDLWQRHPPRRGDLAQWGGAVPDFIAEQPGLASEPYLADSARLDWAVHEAGHAADAPDAAPAVERLADSDPQALRLVLAAGSALVDSRWPVATIWHAHQRDDAARFDAVREAFDAERSECAFVVRSVWTVQVHALDAPTAAFHRALLAHCNLADALDAAADLDFAGWLARALRERWLVAIQTLDLSA
jgi:Putative DNA-binding domain